MIDSPRFQVAHSVHGAPVDVNQIKWPQWEHACKVSETQAPEFVIASKCSFLPHSERWEEESLCMRSEKRYVLAEGKGLLVYTITAMKVNSENALPLCTCIYWVVSLRKWHTSLLNQRLTRSPAPFWGKGTNFQDTVAVRCEFRAEPQSSLIGFATSSKLII